MPQFGAHAFLWIGDWSVEKGNYAIAEAGRHGFDFLEIPLLRPDEFDVAAHREALRAAGIGASASLVKCTGTSTLIFESASMRRKSTCSGRSETGSSW